MLLCFQDKDPWEMRTVCLGTHSFYLCVYRSLTTQLPHPKQATVLIQEYITALTKHG